MKDSPPPDKPQQCSHWNFLHQHNVNTDHIQTKKILKKKNQTHHHLPNTSSLEFCCRQHVSCRLSNIDAILSLLYSRRLNLERFLSGWCSEKKKSKHLFMPLWMQPLLVCHSFQFPLSLTPIQRNWKHALMDYCWCSEQSQDWDPSLMLDLVEANDF